MSVLWEFHWTPGRQTALEHGMFTLKSFHGQYTVNVCIDFEFFKQMKHRASLSRTKGCRVRYLEGGVRVCGDAVWGYFWCGFAVIFVLTCSIAVLQH